MKNKEVIAKGNEDAGGRVLVNKIGEEQASGFKVNKSWKWNVHHDKYSQQYC